MFDPSMFGVLILERDPYRFADLPGLVQEYLNDAGGFLLIGSLLYMLYRMVRNERGHDAGRGAVLAALSPVLPRVVAASAIGGVVAVMDTPTTQTSARNRVRIPAIMLYMSAASVLFYAAYLFLLLSNIGPDTLNRPKAIDPVGYNKVVTPKFSLGDVHVSLTSKAENRNLQPLALALGGICALVGGAAPFVAGLVRVRFRRVWALAVLSFKEVLSKRVYLILLLPLVPLFIPITWFIPSKAEDELRAIVGVASVGIEVAVVLLAVLLASFALPDDVRNQNIYTVVTKPVERVEIVFGRILGYGAFITVGLVALSLVTLLLIETANVSKAAKETTHRARVPVRGTLSFASRKGDIQGIDVGREFNYRKYIGGAPNSAMRAVYAFRNVPGGLATKADRVVPTEFSFDIYRLTKGEENRGVDIGVRVVSWRCPQKPPTTATEGDWSWEDVDAERRYRERAVALLIEKVPRWRGRSPQEVTDPAADLSTARKGTPEWEVADQLAREFGFFDLAGKETYDNSTDGVDLPAGVFEHALAKDDKGNRPPADGLVKVYVRCTTASQMLGMAEGDLYLIESEQKFWVNYLKAKFGDWCWVMIAVTLAICLSTYLDGVVTLLVTAALFVAGFFTQFIEMVARGSGKDGGGPARAFDQLIQAKGSTAQPTGSGAEKAADVLDLVFGWVVQRFINVIPDVTAVSATAYAAEGFDVSVETLAMNGLAVLAYLFPWVLLGYYLLRDREVAA